MPFFIRILKKHKIFYALNTINLVIGLSAFLLVFLVVQKEMSVDRFIGDSSKVFRIISSATINGKSFKEPQITNEFVEKITSSTPEIEAHSRLTSMWASCTGNEKTFNGQKVYFVDKGFFNIFPFQFIAGNIANEYELNGLYIHKSTAIKFFNTTACINKTISINGTKAIIKGVYDYPMAKSHLKPGYIAFINHQSINNKSKEKIANVNIYIKLKSAARKGEMLEKTNNILRNYYTNGVITDLELQNIRHVHLYSGHVKNDWENRGKIDFSALKKLIAIALVLLLISTLNYTNLSIAIVAKRRKEIKVRQIWGLSKKKQIKGFVYESLSLTAVCFILSMFLIQYIVPYASSYLNIYIAYQDLIHINTICLALLLSLIIGLVNSIYPILHILRSQKLSSFKEAPSKQNGIINTRAVLLFAQFFISMVFVVILYGFYKQSQFVKNKDLGFETKDKVVLQLPFHSSISSINEIKQKLNDFPETESIAATSTVTGNSMRFNIQGESNEQVWIFYCPIDFDYLETMGLEIVQGRSFKKSNQLDKRFGMVLNEEAVRVLGIENPIGKKVPQLDDSASIIGVVKNFHLASLHEEIAPCFYRIEPEKNSFLVIRINDNIAPQNFMEKIQGFIKEEYAQQGMLTYTLAGYVDTFYKNEQKDIELLFVLFVIFSSIAIIGLFSYASFVSQARLKEIAIRKVLGADIFNNIKFLAWQIIKIVFFASIAAIPVAYYFIDAWLQNFAYHFMLSLDIFIVPVLAMVSVSFAVSFYHIFKTSITDPIKIIHRE